jgi:integrase
METIVAKAKRTRGTGSIIKIKDSEGKESRFWYLSYWANGRQIRESSKSESKQVAERLLQKRLGELANGKNPVNQKLTYDTMRDSLILDYQKNGMKSLRIRDGKPCLDSVNRLNKFFEGKKASQITSQEITRFVVELQKGGSANATINRSLAALKRMFKLSLKNGTICAIPYMDMLTENNTRTGFVDAEQFKILRSALPDYLKSVVTLAYFTGMRRGEICNLRWSNVDFKSRCIRLKGAETKNGEPRTIPLNTETILMLKMLPQDREFVFGRTGKIVDFRGAWEKAAIAAGVPDLLFHDLRRSAVRDLVRAGVPEKVCMSISGHRTRNVFDRYNIVSESDLHDAMKRREAYAEQDGLSKEDAVVYEQMEARVTQ